MRSSAVAVACIIVSGCAMARTPTLAPTLADARHGTYRVAAHASGVTLDGRMQVLPDTILFSFERTACRSDHINNSTLTVQFRCDALSELDGIVVTIDRRDPVGKARWSASVLHSVTERTCSAYTMVAGVQTCTAYMNTTRQVPSRESGSLVVTREVTER